MLLSTKLNSCPSTLKGTAVSGEKTRIETAIFSRQRLHVAQI